MVGLSEGQAEFVAVCFHLQHPASTPCHALTETGILSQISHQVHTHAGKASSSFEPVRSIQRHMQSAHVSFADEARPDADAAAASGNLREGDRPQLHGQQVPAPGKHASDHVSGAAEAQEHEECNGAETGDRPSNMQAEHTGVNLMRYLRLLTGCNKQNGILI